MLKGGDGLALGGEVFDGQEALQVEYKKQCNENGECG